MRLLIIGPGAGKAPKYQPEICAIYEAPYELGPAADGYLCGFALAAGRSCQAQFPTAALRSRLSSGRRWTSPGWRSIPSWYLFGTEDRAIRPAGQRFTAERGNARIEEVTASHASMSEAAGAFTQHVGWTALDASN